MLVWSLPVELFQTVLGILEKSLPEGLFESGELQSILPGRVAFHRQPPLAERVLAPVLLLRQACLKLWDMQVVGLARAEDLEVSPGLLQLAGEQIDLDLARQESVAREIDLHKVLRVLETGDVARRLEKTEGEVDGQDAGFEEVG